MSDISLINQAAKVFAQGGIIAYPTEAVYGLGCDPDNEEALKKLLALKHRAANKGLILLASDFEQLLPYIDTDKIPQESLKKILQRWPDALTQVLPAKSNISFLLSGAFNSIAVRITDHPDVVSLCRKTNKAIVSTSANVTGKPPAKYWHQVEAYFANSVDVIIRGNTLGLVKPSTIINGLTGEILRP